MARCYSARMAKRQTIPQVILMTDARTDAGLACALARLPRSSAVVFRHYHLVPHERHARFTWLRRLARLRGVRVIGAQVPQSWHTDGAYGAVGDIAGKPGLKLATAHSLREIGAAVRGGAHAILLSPVFPTRSHPGGKALGAVRFLLLARQSPLPVIALGGITRARAARLPVHGWAAIDGLG